MLVAKKKNVIHCDKLQQQIQTLQAEKDATTQQSRALVKNAGSDTCVKLLQQIQTLQQTVKRLLIYFRMLENFKHNMELRWQRYHDVDDKYKDSSRRERRRKQLL